VDRYVVHVLIACISFFATLYAAEGSLHFSSKAVSIASRAKIALESEEGGEKVIEELEALLRDSSFLRLDPQEKVPILFVLSKGYERFGRYSDQEKLLNTYANRRELYRFYVPLKVALVRSYIQQGRIAETDAIIKKIVKSSCGHLPLEEKREIAAMLAFKDEYIFHLLKSADRLMEGGNFSDALKTYETVIACVEKHQFPYQASVVEKRRIRQKILLKKAEARFCLGEYGTVVEYLQDWDDRLFQDKEDQPCMLRRLFLMGSSYQKLGEKERGEEMLSSCPHEWERVAWNTLLKEAPSFSKEYLLWLAYQAYKAHSIEGLQLILKVIQTQDDFPPGIVKVLSGCCHALMQETVVAVEELCSGLTATGPSESAWVETGHSLLCELGWQRVVLLLFSQQIERAKELSNRIISILAPCSLSDHDLSKGLFHLFLYEIEGDISHINTLKELLNKERAVSLRLSFLRAYLENKSEEAYESLGKNGQMVDRLFCLWLYRETEIVNRYFWETDEGSVQKEKSSLSFYSRAILAYRQAMCDEIGHKRATTLLYQALSLASLSDVYPQLLHALVDLSLHSFQHAMAYELLQELIQSHSDYPPLTSLVLSCLVEFEAFPDFEEQQMKLCQYIFAHPTDVHAFAAALHMFEAKKHLFDHVDPSLCWFGKVLVSQEKLRNHSTEIRQSKEPGIIKDELVEAHRNYEDARQHLFMAMREVCGSETHSFLWGTLFSLHQELLDLLCEYLMTDSAFNELPDLIEGAVKILREDLQLMPQKVERWQSYLQPTLCDKCDIMAKTALLCSKIFRGEEKDIIADVKEIIESPLASSNSIRVALFLGKTLRKAGHAEEEDRLLSLLQERKIRHANSELALEIAIEKSLCFWELKQTDKAMAVLAWVINGQYASSLRVKAMILRAELYLSLHRLDLATRQLESVVSKGGEWAVIAERKLREIYGTG